MKKMNLIYALTSCFVLAFSACDDIEDATGKHVYGEKESPYLKATTAATVSTSMKFPTGRFEAQTVKLKEHAEKFHLNMGLTVDEAISGLSDGRVVCYNINVAKNRWDKAEMTKGSTGWYYNTAGGVCKEADAVAYLDFDAAEKALVVNVLEGAVVGTALSFNVGFAIAGPDYDNYVRFSFSLTVTDPGRIVVSNTIPAGDYNSFAIEFAEYAEAIETCMEMTVKEFSSAVSSPDGPIAMYIVNQTTGAWDKESNYTANGIGYWMSNAGKVCTWGDSGATYYIETGEGCVNIGRRESIPSGEVYKMNFVYANKEDSSRFVEFIVTATME